MFIYFNIYRKFKFLFMSRINKYNAFYLSQMAEKQANKKKFVEETRLKQFGSIIAEGQKHDIVTIHLKNNIRINESYGLILEDKELLQDTKNMVCAKFYQDGIKDIAKETRTYLESKNIPEADIKLIEENLESIIMSEGLVDWIKDKVNAGTEVVKKGLSKIWNFLSSSAKAVWDSIVEDIFKPGLEALKNVATKLFGPEVVAAIETTAKKVLNSIDDFMKTSKSIFDGVYASLKDFAQKIANIVKEIWAKVKEVLMKVWGFIKTHAIKVLPGIKPKIQKMTKIGEKVDATKLGEEVKIVGQDVKDMVKYFKGEVIGSVGGSFEDVASSSSNKILSTGEEGKPEEEGKEKVKPEEGKEKEEKKEIIKDSFIWDSLKGYIALNRDFNTEELIKLHETKVNKIFEAENSEEQVEEEGKKTESRGVKAWVKNLVLWVLSPFGKLMEILGDVVAKGLSALPAWLAGKLGVLYEGVKGIISYAAKFTMIGTLVAFIAGVAAESFALTTHLPGEWIKKAEEAIGLEGAVEKGNELIAKAGEGIEKATGVKLKDMKGESKLYKYKEFNKINESEGGGEGKGINWKGLAIGAGSALLAFLVSMFTHAIPGLHAAFETISLILLILATLGYIFTETSWGKNLASKAPLLPNVCKGFYEFVHGH